jgi:hypothetical protein
MDIAYERDRVDSFRDDNFSVDTSSRVDGYISPQGMVRIYYKASDGLIHGLNLFSNFSELDVQRTVGT